MPALGRTAAGIAGIAAVGLAGTVTAGTASAQIVVAPATAYCVGTTYKITVPVADAAGLLLQSLGANDIGVEEIPAVMPVPLPLMSATSPQISPFVGADVTVSWTPYTTGAHTIIAYASTWTGAIAGATEKLTGINVVQSAPAGASCTPTSTTTFGWSSIPVVGSAASLTA